MNDKVILKEEDNYSLKRNTDDFMCNLFNKNKLNSDIIHSDDFDIFYLIMSINDKEPSEQIITITKNTPIVSFYNNNGKMEKIYNNIIKNEFYEHTLSGSSRFLFIEDLNMIAMNSDASHRLAALLKYTQDVSSISLNKKSFEFRKINKQILSRLKIDNRNKTIAYLDHLGYKHLYFLETKEMIDLISFFQKYYLGNVVKLSFIDKIKFKYIYEFDCYTKLNINSFHNSKYELNQYNKQIPVLTKLYYKIFKGNK